MMFKTSLFLIKISKIENYKIQNTKNVFQNAKKVREMCL